MLISGCFLIAHLQVGFAELIMYRRFLRLDRSRLLVGFRRFIEALQVEEAQTEIIEGPHIFRLVGGRLFKMFRGVFVVAAAERLHPFFVSGTVTLSALGALEIARGETRSRRQKAEKRKNQA